MACGPHPTSKAMPWGENREEKRGGQKVAWEGGSFVLEKDMLDETGKHYLSTPRKKRKKEASEDLTGRVRRGRETRSWGRKIPLAAGKNTNLEGILSTENARNKRGKNWSKEVLSASLTWHANGKGMREEKGKL